jgi:hypothetical protein
MTLPCQLVGRRRLPRSARAAFTLLEMLVSASVLVLIIFSLYLMFNYTQRAFRGGVTQVDVQEAGRAVMEMVTREFEQTTATQVENLVNPFLMTNNVAPGPLLVTNEVGTPPYAVLDFWLEDAFCLRPEGNRWRATGYFVGETTTNASDVRLLAAGIGTLFRFEASTNRLSATPPARNWMFNGFVNTANPISAQRVIDGVIHFRINALDENGRVLYAPYTALPADAVGHLAMVPNRERLTKYFDLGDTLPAYLEFELAVVEPDVLAIIKARTEGLAPGPATTARVQSLLGSQANRVHVFRQRIAIRSAPR